MTLVVDTNVILVANRQHEGVSEACITACAKRLLDLTRCGRIAIDDGYRILREYQQKTQPHVGKRTGDAFVKWVLRNNANKERCDQVALVEHSEHEFETFPDDKRLMRSPPDQRKASTFGWSERAASSRAPSSCAQSSCRRSTSTGQSGGLRPTN